jgi:hypothetical protein
VGTRVVRLGAWCDFVTEDEVRVEDFAVLADGRRILLPADRGFSAWGSDRLRARIPAGS